MKSCILRARFCIITKHIHVEISRQVSKWNASFIFNVIRLSNLILVSPYSFDKILTTQGVKDLDTQENCYSYSDPNDMIFICRMCYVFEQIDLRFNKNVLFVRLRFVTPICYFAVRYKKRRQRNPVCVTEEHLTYVNS